MYKENPYFEQTKQNYIEIEKLYKKGKLKHTSSKYKFLAPSVKRQSDFNFLTFFKNYLTI